MDRYRDIEAELRTLGSHSRAQMGPLAPPSGARTSIKRKRVLSAVLATVMVVVVTGSAVAATKLLQRGHPASIDISQIVAATNRTTVRFEGSARWEASLDDEASSGTIRFEGTYDFSTGDGTMEVRFQDGIGGPAAGHRLVDGVMYTRFYRPFEQKRPWIRVNTPDEMSIVSVSTGNEVFAFFRDIQTMTSVDELGEVDIGGVPTIYYQAAPNEQNHEGLTPNFEADYGPVELLIGSDGLVRRMFMSMSKSSYRYGTTDTRFVVDFFDHGIEVDVEPPPADERSDQHGDESEGDEDPSGEVTDSLVFSMEGELPFGFFSRPSSGRICFYAPEWAEVTHIHAGEAALFEWVVEQGEVVELEGQGQGIRLVCFNQNTSGLDAVFNDPSRFEIEFHDEKWNRSERTPFARIEAEEDSG